MEIEVLYFDGCPNHGPAVQLLRDVLAEQEIQATISEVNVRDSDEAQRIGFLGSPSVRVNGVDIDPSARLSRECGMMCRTYTVNGRREGTPSREMVLQVILSAQSRAKDGSEGSGAEGLVSWFAAGSVIAAMVA